MKRRDFTVAELREYDGVKNERILLSVNGKVFDVTNRGKSFYGPSKYFNSTHLHPYWSSDIIQLLLLFG